MNEKHVREALRSTARKADRDAVDQARQDSLRLKRQARIRRFRGKLDWQGDLDAMRSDGAHGVVR
jgi:hypothetical protein